MKHISVKTLMLGLGFLGLASCGDPDDVITSIDYARNFSPTSFEAKVRNRTNVELNWTVSEGVTNYNVEVYANDSLTFAGTPVRFTISREDVPYLVTGLEGETHYSFRVQAITEGFSSLDSKWSSAYAKTDAEQILASVAANDVKAKEVTLRWPAGEEAATITLTPGDIVYNITAADIAAGAATITGLTPETSYTAIMARANGKTRGKASFKTGIDLAETDILVNPGEDIAAVIAAAPEGYRLVIQPGEYGIAAGGDTPAAFGGSVTITKEISIKGLRADNHPVIKGRIKVEAPLALDQVTLDGKGTDGGQALDVTAEGTISYITVTNSEVMNYTKGLLYMNQATLVETITFENCFIKNIECSGGDFLDARKGGYNTLSFKNNTVANSAAKRDFIRMDDNSGNVTAAANIIVDHNTFYNVGNGDANYRMFYVRWKTGNKITFTNNIVVGFNNKRGFANQSATDQEPKLENNVYFNTKNLLSLADGNTEKVSWFDTTGQELDPQFVNADGDDFTVQNDNVKDTKAGAPRWY